MTRWRVRASGAADLPDLDYEDDRIDHTLVYRYPVLHFEALTDRTEDIPGRRPRRVSERAQLIQIAIERRKLLRAAFDVIRHDPDLKPVVAELAAALGGSKPVTPDLLETARKILRAAGTTA